MISPTQRSNAMLRGRGCAVATLEHWNSHVGIRQDAFGFIDLMAVLPSGEPFFVQTTTQTGIARRRDKILDIVKDKPQLAALVRAGRVMLHGWAKRRENGRQGGRLKWSCREEVMTIPTEGASE